MDDSNLETDKSVPLEVFMEECENAILTQIAEDADRTGSQETEEELAAHLEEALRSTAETVAGGAASESSVRPKNPRNLRQAESELKEPGENVSAQSPEMQLPEMLEQLGVFDQASTEKKADPTQRMNRPGPQSTGSNSSIDSNSNSPAGGSRNSPKSQSTVPVSAVSVPENGSSIARGLPSSAQQSSIKATYTLLPVKVKEFIVRRSDNRKKLSDEDFAAWEQTHKKELLEWKKALSGIIISKPEVPQQVIRNEWTEVECPKVLGDVFESVAGAIFLDCEFDLARLWQVYQPLLCQDLGT